MSQGVNVVIWTKARIKTALGIDDDIKQSTICVIGIAPYYTVRLTSV